VAKQNVSLANESLAVEKTVARWRERYRRGVQARAALASANDRARLSLASETFCFATSTCSFAALQVEKSSAYVVVNPAAMFSASALRCRSCASACVISPFDPATCEDGNADARLKSKISVRLSEG